MQDTRDGSTERRAWRIGAVGEEGRGLAGALAERCGDLLRPLLEQLAQTLDLRLVRTVANAVTALVRHRDRPHALLLSELGGYLAGPEHAPAGTKRLGNLLHSERWQASAIDDFLLERGRGAVGAEAERVAEGRALCILDSSVLEKPESVVAEGLRPVRSSKARRLTRPRPKQGKGYYRGKPGGPIVVPGFSWAAVLVTGWAGAAERRPVSLGAWHWYSKPTEVAVPLEGPTVVEPTPPPVGDGVPRQRLHEAEWAVVERVVAAWGADRLLHVWDRGMSGAPWLGQALDTGWHFVVRWKKGNHLRPATAPSVGNPAATAAQRERDAQAAWKLTAGLRNWGERQGPNPRSPRQPITVGFAARPVALPGRDDPLWLVVARVGARATRRRRKEPWRLLTTEPVTTPEQCWRIVEAYAARWAIEQQLRFGKSELGIESVRVRDWEPRHKLLGLVALAYAFLVDLLGDRTPVFLPALLRWAHRTGRQANQAYRCLYRLREALANLWQQHTPSFHGFP
jgi:hypothetical protein